MVKKLLSTGKGEVLSLHEEIITKEKLENFSEMYKTFIKTKQMLNIYGIEVNGIIAPTEYGQLESNEIEEKWASSFYGFSDVFGLPPKFPEICIDSVYYHPRSNLFDYSDGFKHFKEAIDKDINEKNYRVIHFFAESGETLDYLSQFLDYVKQK